ncbi:MAG: UDP-N-acetylmuramate dehydrogenase [Lachnospiraceae bacterium]|nr:UDP-N-acetylmuramate dehydrogenase [Lachnospiraceae bacterium]
MEVRINEPMMKHTSFRAGGAARWFAVPETAEELKAVLAACRKADTPWYVIGNGSNLLVSDKGFPGVIISTDKFDRLEVNGTEISVGAGVMLSKLANTAYKAGLTGLEFAAGIPGTVGGACVMNAGAYGSEMINVLKSVTVLTPEGNVETLPVEMLELGYRTSVIPKKGYLVLEAVMSLTEGNMEESKALMDDLAFRRKDKQPLEFPSAGSTFKRPAGHFAGKLIEDCGLKGFTVGGAQVSEKHAGFVINKGGATASDIYNLCKEVEKRVKAEFGVSLEMEVKLLGEFEEE